MRTIIVYYSMGGNTAFAAEMLAERLGAETLRLEPVQAYPDKGARKFLWGGKSALMGEQPPLKPYTFDASAWDRVILGFPVWAALVTPPIRTFVAQNGTALKDKRIAAFACQAGSGAEKALAKLRELLGREALEAELILIDPKTRPGKENGERMDAFARSLEEDRG